MKYEKLFDEFIQCFPDDQFRLKELAECAAVEASDGMHIMFGMVVVPFLMELLENYKDNKLKVAFAYFERMAEVDDPMILEVLEFTVLEDLISRGKTSLDKFKSYMGAKTIESCIAVEKYMM